MKRNPFLLLLALLAAVWSPAAVPSARILTGPGPSFNIDTTPAWLHWWGPSSSPTGNTDNTAGVWLTSKSGVTETLTATDKAIFHATGWNSALPCFQGDRATNLSLAYTFGASVSPPFSILIWVQHQGSVSSSSYAVVACNDGAFPLYCWVATNSDSTQLSEQFNGSNLYGGEYLQNRELIVVEIDGTDSYWGKNGPMARMTHGSSALNETDAMTGLKLWQYPTGTGLNSSARILGVGIVAGHASRLSWYKGALRWTENTAAIPTASAVQIIYAGDSRTQGESYAKDTPAGAWPAVLGARWTDSVNQANCALPAQTIADQLTADVTYVDPNFSRPLAARTVLVLSQPGTNDVLGAVALATIEANITTWIGARRAAAAAAGMPLKVVFTTIPYCFHYGTTANGNRATLNTWIMANSAGADLVVDIAKDGMSPQSSNPLGAQDDDTPYFPANWSLTAPEYLHYSLAGNIVVADYMEAAFAGSPINVTYDFRRDASRALAAARTSNTDQNVVWTDNHNRAPRTVGSGVLLDTVTP